MICGIFWVETSNTHPGEPRDLLYTLWKCMIWPFQLIFCCKNTLSFHRDTDRPAEQKAKTPGSLPCSSYYILTVFLLSNVSLSVFLGLLVVRLSGYKSGLVTQSICWIKPQCSWARLFTHRDCVCRRVLVCVSY